MTADVGYATSGINEKAAKAPRGARAAEHVSSAQDGATYRSIVTSHSYLC